MIKKIIVSGVTGQDGSYMVEYLLKNTPHHIIGGVRRTSQLIKSNLNNFINDARFKIASLDLTDVHSVTSLIADEKPDYFINFGASTFVPDSWNQPAAVMQVNTVSLIYILEAIKKFVPNCRVYSAGSSEQWGDVLGSPQNESTPMRPRSVYGVSKCAASHICKVYRESYGLYIVHGVLLNHESPRRQPGDMFVTRKITQGVARIARSISKIEPFLSIKLGNINSKRDWSYAPDFIDGIWRMVNQEHYRLDTKFADNTNTRELSKYIKEYILASGETHSVREFVELAFRLAKIEGYWVGEGINEKFIISNYLNDISELKSQVLVEISPELFRPNEVDLLCGDSSMARKELGWIPQVSFEELVRIMVEYDLKNL